MIMNKQDVFAAMENTLLNSFGEVLYEDGKTVRETLSKFKNWNLDGKVRDYFSSFGKSYSAASNSVSLNSNDYDAFYYWVSVYVIFYAGMRFETVTKYLPGIHKWFGDYSTAAMYTESQMQDILNDPSVIKYKQKLLACRTNAKKFQSIVSQYGSFHNYRDSWPSIPTNDKSDYISAVSMSAQRIAGMFDYFGVTVALHFLTDICENVIKPDRHVCNVLYRLGLTENQTPQDEGKLEASFHGCDFASVSGNVPRYADIVLMRFGYHICLPQNPQCQLCPLTVGCEAYNRRRPINN